MIILKYLKDLTSVFFKWWWAAITAVATLIPLFKFPTTITVSNTAIALVFFFVCLLLFLALAMVARGYSWYVGSHNAPTVKYCLPAVPGGGEETVTISSVHELELGQILTVLRTTNYGTGCFGIVKVARRLGSQSNQYQCSPLWIGPSHRKDLVENRVQVEQLTTSLFLGYDDLANLINGTQAS